MKNATQIADFFFPHTDDNSASDYWSVSARIVLSCIAQKLEDEKRLTNAALDKVVFEMSRADLCDWLKATAAESVIGVGAVGAGGVLVTLAQAVHAARQNQA